MIAFFMDIWEGILEFGAAVREPVAGWAPLVFACVLALMFGCLAAVAWLFLRKDFWNRLLFTVCTLAEALAVVTFITGDGSSVSVIAAAFVMLMFAVIHTRRSIKNVLRRRWFSPLLGCYLLGLAASGVVTGELLRLVDPQHTFGTPEAMWALFAFGVPCLIIDVIGARVVARRPAKDWATDSKPTIDA